MQCTEPFVRGPEKGMPKTGTPAGYAAHIRHYDPPCDLCKKAILEYHTRRRQLKRTSTLKLVV